MSAIDAMMRQKSELQDVVPNRDILVFSLIGSQNYWLDDENSDVDTIAWVTPTFKDICDSKGTYSKTKALDGGEAKVRDFRKGIDLFLKQNPADLEMLFTDDVLVDPSSKFIYHWKTLRQNREEIARLDQIKFTQSVYGQAYQAYKNAFFNNKSGKYAKYDPKALSNVFRFYDMLFNYVNGAPFAECLIAKPLTKSIKFEKITFNFETANDIAQEKLQGMLTLKERMKDKNPAVDDDTVSMLYDTKKSLTALALEDILEKL